MLKTAYVRRISDCSSDVCSSDLAPMAEINVTPLVDVMLVLLIIFMITAPLLTAAVPIDLPESRAKPVETEDQEPIQLSVGADDTLYIGAEVVPEADLPARPDAIARGHEGQGRPRQIMAPAHKGPHHDPVVDDIGQAVGWERRVQAGEAQGGQGITKNKKQ